MKELIVSAILMLVAMIAVVVFALYMSRATCFAEWERSGMKVEWAPIQGCVLQLPDGTWLPADRFREVD
jgi:hypothetical protein